MKIAGIPVERIQISLLPRFVHGVMDKAAIPGVAIDVVSAGKGGVGKSTVAVNLWWHSPRKGAGWVTDADAWPIYSNHAWHEGSTRGHPVQMVTSYCASRGLWLRR